MVDLVTVPEAEYRRLVDVVMAGEKVEPLTLTDAYERFKDQGVTLEQLRKWTIRKRLPVLWRRRGRGSAIIKWVNATDVQRLIDNPPPTGRPRKGC